MAERKKQVPFTIGDQLDIQETKILVKQINRKLDPTLPIRVASLEGSRTKWSGGFLTGLVIVIGGIALWGLKALLMASTGIPVP